MILTIFWPTASHPADKPRRISSCFLPRFDQLGGLESLQIQTRNCWSTDNMSPRNLLCLVFAVACACQVGCCGCLSGARCGSCCDPCCGVPEASCACPSCGCADSCCDCVSCGVADPGCCCPEPACCCPEPSCACDASCGVPCGCGTPVCGSCYPNQRLCDCPLLMRYGISFVVVPHAAGVITKPITEIGNPIPRAPVKPATNTAATMDPRVVLH